MYIADVFQLALLIVLLVPLKFTGTASAQKLQNQALAKFKWRPTSATEASSRYDDVHFITPDIGWAVNSNAQVIHTRNGGRSWITQVTLRDVNDRPIYLRSIQFANKTHGILGTLSKEMRLYKTSNGGRDWVPHPNLPADAPLKVCGLTMVSETVAYGTGTNSPRDFAAMMKTVDGGRSWTAKSLEKHASILIDNYFFDAKRGLVVGGYTDVPRGRRTRKDMKPVILQTEDGGETWTNLLKGFESQYPKGEWGWKIFVVNKKVIYVSLQNYLAGAVAKTSDGGKTWTRLLINDAQGNKNLEGIGFISEKVGWVGGWGDATFRGGYSSATLDGGVTWEDATKAVGTFINRFRFVGSPIKVGYASGRTIYKYSAEPELADGDRMALTVAEPKPMLRESTEILSVKIPLVVRFTAPLGAARLRLHIWDRFGILVCTLLAEENPEAGEREVSWDGTDDKGARVEAGAFIYRLRIDDRTESRVVLLSR